MQRHLVTLILFCLFGTLYAGNPEDGYIEINILASNQADQQAIEGATVTVYKGPAEVQKLLTSKKGKASIQLKYGDKYRIVLSKDGFVTSYFVLDGNIPQKKYVMISGFQQQVFFIDKKERNIDTVRFRHPFTKWTYDTKTDRFTEDAAYLKIFEEGIFQEDIDAQKATDEKLEKEKAEKAGKDKQERLLAEQKRHDDHIAEYMKKARIAGKFTTGGATSKPIMNGRVVMKGPDGKVLQTTTTNALGGFAFTKAPADGNFTIDLEGVNPKFTVTGSSVMLFTKDGKQVITATADSEGKFHFTFLNTDKTGFTELSVTDPDLRVDITGAVVKADQERTPLTDLNVNLVDKNGAIVQTVKTDSKGRFHFKALTSDGSYLFGINENDPQLKGGEVLYITDAKGKIIKELTKGSKAGFRFEILPDEEHGMACIYADDPWLQVIDADSPTEPGKQKSLVIKEHVYFKSDDATLLPEAQATLNEVISVMENVPNINIELSSHTDSNGSDEYNMALSERRAKSAVDYILAHGIDPKRISGKGYGETQLLNRCANGVKCSDEEHAQNRRLEFKIVKN